MINPLETVYDQIRDLVTQELSLDEIVDRVIEPLKEKALRLLAAEYVKEVAGELVRAREYQVRQAAMQRTPPQRTPPQRTPPQRPEPPHGVAQTARSGCTCAKCEQWREREREHQDRIHASLSKIIGDYEKELRAEWTEELLASTFGTPNGRVTWADATVDDHQAHIQMNIEHMEGYARDAALHEQAIKEIEERGSTCLKEALTAAAAPRA